jgi:hypothetical protein
MKTFNEDAVVSMFMNVDNVITNAVPFFFSSSVSLESAIQYIWLMIDCQV